jgi:hypothetical protein
VALNTKTQTKTQTTINNLFSRFILLLDYHWYLQTFLTFIEIGKPGEKQSNVNVIVEWDDCTLFVIYKAGRQLTLYW